MKFKLVSDEKREIHPNWEHVKIYVSRYKPHTSFDLEVVRRVARRSDPLRKYYFSAVLPEISRKSGYESHEDLQVHEYLKARYFKIEPDSRGILRDVPSVFSNESKLKVPEKKKFVDYVIRMAALSGIYIEDPK